MNKFRKPHGSNRPEGRFGGAKFGRGPATRPQGRGTYAPAGTAATGQKFEAVCSNCGAACQVPFRPSPGKPVYCKNCFDAPRGALPALKRSSSARGAAAATGVAPIAAARGGGGEGGKTIADLTRQIAAMNAKIDTMLKILEEGA